MGHRTKKTRREIGEIASRFDLTYAGTTTQGHFCWLHGPTGRIATSVSDLKNDRAKANVTRAFKQRIRQFEQQGAAHGHNDPD